MSQSQHLSQAELEFWAKRVALFHDTTETVLPAVRKLGATAFAEHYLSAEAEWKGEAHVNPSIPPKQRSAGGVLQDSMEDICKVADEVPEGDHRMYVLPIPSLIQ
jgi:hypothetical protein